MTSPSRICGNCFTGTIRTATPNGHDETIHGLPSYITRGTATSNSTIIFLPDAFGVNLVNNKLLADQYASRTGFRILMPNLLPGGGVPLVMMGLNKTMMTATPWWNLLGHAKRAWAALRIMTILVPFGFRVKRLYPAVLNYVRAVRASLPLGARLGIAGFCLGGLWSSRICGEAATDSGDSHLVDAHFTAHPSSIRVEELAGFAAKFRVPFSMALGDKDVLMPVAVAHEVDASLREVFREEPEKLQVSIYERCGHGFALRADPNETHENEGAEMALEQAVAWFRRFLA